MLNLSFGKGSYFKGDDSMIAFCPFPLPRNFGRGSTRSGRAVKTKVHSWDGIKWVGWAVGDAEEKIHGALDIEKMILMAYSPH